MALTDMDFLFARPLVAPWKEASQYARAEEVVARAQRGSPPPPEPKRVRPGALKAPHVGGWVSSPLEGDASSSSAAAARAADERALERGRQARLRQQRDAAQQQQQAQEARRVHQQHQAVGDNALRGRGWRDPAAMAERRRVWVAAVGGSGGGGGGGGGHGDGRRSASPARRAMHSERSGSSAAAGARPPSARAAAAATRAVVAAAAARAAAAAARAATPAAMTRAREAAREAAGSNWAEQVLLWRGLRCWRAAAARKRRRHHAVAVADRSAPLHAQRTRRAACGVQRAWRARQVRALRDTASAQRHACHTVSLASACPYPPLPLCSFSLSGAAARP